MAEKVLKIKTVTDVAEAVAGLTDLSGSLKGVGTAAIETAGKSKAEWVAFDAELKKTNPTLKGISEAAFAAQGALNKMGSSTSASQIEKNMVAAQVAVNKFEAELEKARAAGATIDDGFVASLDLMKAGVAEMKTRLVSMNDETERAREQLGLLGAAGKRAGEDMAAGMKKAEAASRDAWSELETLGEEGKAAAVAMRALENASGPRELAKNAGLAAFHVEELTNKLKASGPAGEAAMKRVAGAVKEAEKSIDGAANKAAKMADAVGDLKTKASMAGDSLTTLKGSAGSLDGMFERMRDTGTGATKTLGSIGVAAGIAGAAVMGAVAAGKELAAAIDAWDEKRAKKDKADTDAKVKAELLNAANRAVTKGLIEQGKTVDETIERYVAMSVRMGKLSESARDYISTTAGMKAPVAWEDVERKAKAMADTIAGAYKRSEEEGHRWVLANAPQMKEIIAAFDEVGRKAPEALGQSLAAAEKWAEGNRKAAASARAMVPAVDELAAALTNLSNATSKGGDPAAQIDSVAKALNEIKRSGGDVSGAVAQNFEALQRLRIEAEKSGDTLTKYRQEIMDAIPAWQATALAGGDYAKAIQEQTEAAERYELARREANKADIEASIAMAQARDAALDAARSVDTIGQAWERVTGQCAGFSVEVRHQTKEVQEVDPAFTALIESLAGVSDEFERMTPWVGNLIARLEKGDVTFAGFQKQIEAWRTGFMQIQGLSGQMFGPIDELFNRLNHLLNEFTRKKR